MAMHVEEGSLRQRLHRLVRMQLGAEQRRQQERAEEKEAGAFSNRVLQSMNMMEVRCAVYLKRVLLR